MKAKDYFDRIKGVERNIESAMSRVELLECMAERITVSLDGEVVSRSRNVHSQEDAIIRLAEARTELKQLNDTYSYLVSIITKKMGSLEDPEDEKLLRNHYLLHMSLTETAVKMHHAKAWAYRRHDQALEKLDAILVDLVETDIFPCWAQDKTFQAGTENAL